MKFGLIVAGVLVVGTVVVLVWLSQRDIPVDISSGNDDRPAVSAQEQPLAKTAVSSNAGKIPEKRQEEPGMNPPNDQLKTQVPDIEAAMSSMRRSLEEGDQRTPPLAEQGMEMPEATPEQLADPELYQQFEAQQSARVAAIYLSAIKEIPLIQQRITQARMSGSQSQADIREAEEALAQLEALKQQFELEHPQILELMETQTEAHSPDNP